MKKKAMRENIFGRKANGVQEVEEKGATLKEQRVGIGSDIR